MKYTIEMRPTRYDSFEPINSDYNARLVSADAQFTNKKAAFKELHRLERLIKAGNDLRKIEGSAERRYYSFRLVNESGAVVTK